MWTWARLFEDKEYQRIGLYEDERIRISTVWLGLDHNWGAGPPIIFESMIFAKDPTIPYDEWQYRYATLKEAEKGHKRIVACYHEGLDLEGAMKRLREEKEV